MKVSTDCWLFEDQLAVSRDHGGLGFNVDAAFSSGFDLYDLFTFLIQEVGRHIGWKECSNAGAFFF